MSNLRLADARLRLHVKNGHKAVWKFWVTPVGTSIETSAPRDDPARMAVVELLLMAAHTMLDFDSEDAKALQAIVDRVEGVVGGLMPAEISKQDLLRLLGASDDQEF